MLMKLALMISMSIFGNQLYSSEKKLSEIVVDPSAPQLFQYNSDKDVYWKAIGVNAKPVGLAYQIKRSLSFDSGLKQVKHNEISEKVAMQSAYLASVTCNEELKKFPQRGLAVASDGLSASSVQKNAVKDDVPMDFIASAHKENSAVVNSAAMDFVAAAIFSPGLSSPSKPPMRKKKNSLSEKEKKLMAKKSAMKRL